MEKTDKEFDFLAHYTDEERAEVLKKLALEEVLERQRTYKFREELEKERYNNSKKPR